VTSAPPTRLARCQFCGREFDSHGFQVFLAGAPARYDSTECALRAAEGEAAPARARLAEDEAPRAHSVR